MISASAAPPRPLRTIGFWTAVSLVLGNMIGSGVFLLPASLAKYGGLSLAGWLVSTAGATLLALVFARLARAESAAGGPYAFTRRGFGDLAGFLVAWGYWISCWTTNAALAVAFVGYLDPFFPTLVRTPVIAAVMAVAAVWLLTCVNIAGVRAAGHVQLVTTALKILPLVVVGAAGLFAFQPAHFAITQTGAGAIGRDLMATTTLTLWAFLGLECATIPAGSMRDPSRTIPRATVTGTLLAAVIYILSTIGVMSVLSPEALGATTAPFADAARAFAGSRAAEAVALGAAISCFGALNGWILMVGQLPLAVAEDGLFPRAFGRLSSRGTPAVGMIVSGVLTTALIGMNYSKGLVDLFTFIILLATLSTLIPYVYCSLSTFLMPNVERSPRADLIAALAFVYALGAIAGAGADVVYWGFVLLLAGLPVYVWVKRPGRAGVSAHSEFGILSRVGVKHVRDAWTDRAIETEWMDLNFTAAPDRARAAAECDRFVEIVASGGAEIVALPPAGEVGLDSIYVRDASIVCDRGVILCNMGKPQRRGEPDAQRVALEAAGCRILGGIASPGRIEGGDVAWLDARTLAVGRGYRTNDEGIRQLRALLADAIDELIVVPLPHWRGPGDVFHLMSIISPVDRDLAVVYSPLLPVPFREWLIDRGFDLVEVPDAEFESMGTNVLAIAPRVCVMVEGNPRTRAALEQAGARVLEYAGGEISLKGGGGPTCLTRPLARGL